MIAPHGGGIEPGTSELAEAIAGVGLSFYVFEGIKEEGNRILHITSSRFDEPEGVALVAASPRVVAVHGEEESQDCAVFLGGLDKGLGAEIRASLEAAGFGVRTHKNPDMQGLHKNNICNRGQSAQGVQLELSRSLRESFFRELDNREGRQHPTESFFKFVKAMRKGLFEYPSRARRHPMKDATGLLFER